MDHPEVVPFTLSPYRKSDPSAPPEKVDEGERNLRVPVTQVEDHDREPYVRERRFERSFTPAIGRRGAAGTIPPLSR